MTEAAEEEIPEEIIVALSDYLDNVLPPDVRADVETKIANDAVWKSAHAEMIDARSVVMAASARKLAAINGDRVPFVAILVVALLGLGVIAYIMWSSPTGSLKVNKDQKPGAQGSAIVDKP